MAKAPKFWLMKSEPDVFSLDDLKALSPKSELWDGVRNYQARNFMRDEMSRGDGVLFYHSNCTPPGVAGLAFIASDKAEPDPTQFDKGSKYYDPKSSKEDPRWVAARVAYMAHFPQLVDLATLKETGDLRGMKVVQRGMRLSIQPVEQAHFLEVCKLGGFKGALKLLKDKAQA